MKLLVDYVKLVMTFQKIKSFNWHWTSILWDYFIHLLLVKTILLLKVGIGLFQILYYGNSLALSRLVACLLSQILVRMW